MKQFEGHSPGPWIARCISKEPMSPIIQVRAANDRPVAFLGTQDFEDLKHSTTEDEANTRLCAAAPQLLQQRDALLTECRKIIAQWEALEIQHYASLKAAIALCGKD